MLQTDWYTFKPHAVADSLDVDVKTGLTLSQVHERQLLYGRNALQTIKSRPAWRILVDQFTSIVIALLGVAAGISWATGDTAEPPSRDIMAQPPRTARTTLLSRSFLFLIGWQAVLLAALALGAYIWALQRYGPGSHARTVALFSLVAVQLGHTFNCRSRTRSAFEGLFRNPFLWMAAGIVILLQLLAAYWSPLAAILGTIRPSLTDWLVICASGLLTVIMVEITKWAADKR